MEKTSYLIIAAQKEELDGVFASLKTETLSVCGFDVILCQTDKNLFFGAIGGIGKVSMAHCLTLLLDKLNPDYVINTGVCGSIDPKLKKLEIFIGSKCAYHDVDVTAFGYKKGQMAQMPLYFECDKELLSSITDLNLPYVKEGLILSGDAFITKDNIRKEWFTDFDKPIACDMESAAVGQICYQENIPFLIIRAVSDGPCEDEDNTSSYNHNLDEASRQAGELVRQIIFSR